MDGDAAANELTKKIGPLPLWAWLGVGGGVLLLLLRGSGGGGSATSGTSPSDGSGALDASGGGSGGLDLPGALDLGPISVGGNAGGVEDPIADPIASPATSVSDPIGGSPDAPAAIPVTAPIGLDIGTRDDGSIILGGAYLGSIASDPGTALALADPGYGGPLQAMLTPSGMLYSTSPLIPRPGQAVADFGGDINPSGNAPALEAFAAANPDQVHVIAQPYISPAGVIANATTPQTDLGNGNVVVPAVYVPGTIIPAGTAQVA